MENNIEFDISNDCINIKIPIDLLCFAGENHPETPLIIKNKEQFAQKVMFELQHNLGSYESGLSGFQELIDQAMIKVAESGYDFVDIKTPTHDLQ